MASEHDILSRLPEAPAPAPHAPQAPTANALERFDKRNRTLPQGSAHDLRLMQQTASFTPPSRRRSVMRARNVIAASVAVLVAGSALGVYVHKMPAELNIAYDSKEKPIVPPTVYDRLEVTKPQPQAP